MLDDIEVEIRETALNCDICDEYQCGVSDGLKYALEIIKKHKGEDYGKQVKIQQEEVSEV